jgi:uncharacterized protein YdcH (DUF465 family)
MSAEDSTLKEILIHSNSDYRQLTAQHHQFDERLSELAAIHFPSEEEQLEEVTLKKKKLAIKDQMESLLHDFKSTSAIP